MSKTASTSQDQIVFERMEAIHRGAKRGYWVYATLLILLGLAIVLSGVFGWLAWLPAVLVGIVTLAVAVLPLRDALERGERIEGLGILRDEWAERC